MSSRFEYIEQMKLQLDKLNTKLDDLDSRKDALSADAAKKYDEQMTELRKQSQSARAKMNEIKEASEDKWETLVTEGEKVQKAFVHSYNYFISQMKA